MKRGIILSIILLMLFSMSMFAALDLRWKTEITYSPAAPTAGETVQFSATLKAGFEAVDDVDVELRIDGVPYGRTIIPHMNLGQEIVVTLPWIAAAGTHTVMMYADPDNDYIENSDINNSREMTITIAAGSGVTYPAGFDLIWNSSMSSSPDPFYAGDVVSLSAAIQSQNSACDSVLIHFIVDGAVVDTRTIAHLNSNESMIVTFTWTAVAGPHTGSLVIDPLNTIPVENQSNNTLTASGTVETRPVGGDTRDLQWIGDMTVSPDPPVPGSNLAISGTVRSLNTASDSILVRLVVDGSIVDSTTISHLGAGATQTVTLNWSASLGTHTGALVIDPNNTIPETNETNNTLSNTGTIEDRTIARCDLKWVSAIDIHPNPPVAGSNLRVSAQYLVEDRFLSNVRIQLKVDGAVVATSDVPNLPMGVSTWAVMNWPAATAGSHTIAMVLSQNDSTIFPEDLPNNTITRAINVPSGSSPSAPSLTVTAATLMQQKKILNMIGEGACAGNEDKTVDLEAVSITTKPISGNQTYREVTLKIKNNGLKCVHQFMFEVKDSNDQLIYRQTVSHPAGKTYAITGNVMQVFKFNVDKRIIRETEMCGRADNRVECSTFTLFVDPRNEIAESKENNNSKGPIFVPWEVN